MEIEMTDQQKFEEASKWVGKRVRRGPDWRYSSQDDGGEGVVVSARDTYSFGWVEVKWDSGPSNTYRVVDFKDLEVVEEVKISRTEISKITKCLICNSPGDDLIFKFYCSKPSCRNYHP